MKLNTLLYFDSHRHATWLELFFDLVFVAAIGIIGHTLAEPHHGHFSLMQLPEMLLQFIPVWWVWAFIRFIAIVLIQTVSHIA